VLEDRSRDLGAGCTGLCVRDKLFSCLGSLFVPNYAIRGRGQQEGPAGGIERSSALILISPRTGR
jgi:hypothetical protein